MDKRDCYFPSLLKVISVTEKRSKEITFNSSRLTLPYKRKKEYWAVFTNDLHAFQHAINLHYGLTAPDDPQRRQTYKVGNNIPENVKTITRALNELIW